MLLVYIVEYNQSRDISLSLYRYVCHHVVGSEEAVKTRRMFHTMGDNLFHNEVFSKITSGSSGEGLEMKGSDVDVMPKDQLHILIKFNFVQHRLPHLNLGNNHFVPSIDTEMRCTCKTD